MCKNGTENNLQDSGSVPSLRYLYVNNYESVDDNNYEEGPSLVPMCLLEEDEKLSLVKRVASLNLFGESGLVRVIFDMVSTIACNPHMSYFVNIKMKRDTNNLK